MTWLPSALTQAILSWVVLTFLFFAMVVRASTMAALCSTFCMNHISDVLRKRWRISEMTNSLLKATEMFAIVPLCTARVSAATLEEVITYSPGRSSALFIVPVSKPRPMGL